jgi:DNA-binding NarL/FixJ family response regulator
VSRLVPCGCGRMRRDFARRCWRCYVESRRGVPAPRPSQNITEPTRREAQILATWAACGSLKEAAARLGIADLTARQMMTILYRRLGVEDGISAMRVLGWLRVPEEWAP